MKFTLTINGETPAELLGTLTQLCGMTINVNTSPNGGGETRAMTAAELPRHASPQPQSEPVPQPEKSKAQTSAKPKHSAQKSAAAPAEEQQANPTMTDTQSAPAAPAATSSAATSAPSASDNAASAPTETPVTTTSSEPGKDPATEDKIRSLIMALMKQGKTKECKAIITNAGAASISTIKPESYTAVWEQLCKLSEEVNQNAAE